MDIDVVVTAPEAQNLVCPFTGKHMPVHMIVRSGSVVYCSPDAFTVAEPVSSMDKLVRRTTMRNGVYGAVEPNTAKTCPYTGESYRLRTLPDGKVCYVGGFNPRAGKGTLGEFLYYATMRDGVPTMNCPRKFVAMKGGKEAKALAKKELGISDETLKAAEAAVDKAGLVHKAVRGASFRKGS